MFSRRTVLKGMAAGLFAPYFHDVYAQSSARPARLVLVLECNGVYPRALLSTGTRTALGGRANTSDRLFWDAYKDAPLVREGDNLASAISLGPLAASSGNIDLVNRSAVLLGLSSLIAGGGHSSGTGGLSCAVNGAGATFDAVIAPRLRRGAPFDVLRLGTSSARVSIVYETCALGPRKPAGIIVNPSLAFDSTFGSLLGGSTNGRDRKMLFDFALADSRKALAEFRGNSNERLKLERYLSSLESLRTREDQLAGMADRVRPYLPLAPKDNPLITGAGSPPDSLKWFEAQFQIATASLLGGLTNTVVLATGTSGFDVAYGPDVADIARHSLQHGLDAGQNWDRVAEVTRRHVQLVANLARTLAATPEVGASGSMLDHTAIVFMSDNGEQHHSTSREWPKLVVGGNALGLKTDGRTVVYPKYDAARNRQVSNLFNTLGHAFGDADFNTFGQEGSTRIAPGPLSELYG
ncbi:DUF1552 domain-containing protein [Myxococcus sp. CA051A]|uniref:DUF1552 domain-containing protein n=1 Tax=Myxococcus llanfairpwllgwyngyllgogerychwyrndrobwllllantysiliogogogochensis TaxID=2590453 RepID=A0A540WJV1_9BACT|nr:MULTISPECIES: DUF1552 domain-containing protein [Myxococcus]NTX14762.1 DUF1552 domain-containing protein [Myxococcus sp. CA056]NTX66596.1 DUF1552 domain-containing protein [Myxococcus sp. CA051A]TQF09306.1 DUF1552 domain-containing protein [Myxococcus llanfairpwllgwyngyllgogerychwyrndrobwllllantysiliogogogochensis]